VTAPDVERHLLRFLESLEGDARSLVINGDLFDFWFEWRSVIPRTGFRTLAALARLSESGTSIIWIAGNHDCWGGEVLRADAGVAYQVGSWSGAIAGWNTRIDHGDGLRGQSDRRYRALRRVLRNPWAVRAFRLLHPDVGTWLAQGSSRASRVHRARDGGAELRDVALRELASTPDLDLLVFGHTHVAALERAPGGGVYANAGTWIDDTTYLRIDAEAVELRRWAMGRGADEVVSRAARRSAA
jgi:UDP-2,3-diacylglucosamine hydrolase